MGRAQQIASKVASIAKRLGGMVRTVYKRTYVITGDALTGRSTNTPTTTLFEPQPIYNEVAHRAARLSADAQKTIIPSDYLMLFATTAATGSVFADPNLVLVFKDAAGNEEIYEVIHYFAPGFAGVEMFVQVIARRK